MVKKFEGRKLNSMINIFFVIFMSFCNKFEI